MMEEVLSTWSLRLTMSDVVSVLLLLRIAPTTSRRMNDTRPMTPIRKNLECRMLLRSNLDWPGYGLTGVDLAVIWLRYSWLSIF